MSLIHVTRKCLRRIVPRSGEFFITVLRRGAARILPTSWLRSNHRSQRAAEFRAARHSSLQASVSCSRFTGTTPIASPGIQ